MVVNGADNFRLPLRGFAFRLARQGRLKEWIVYLRTAENPKAGRGAGKPSPRRNGARFGFKTFLTKPHGFPYHCFCDVGLPLGKMIDCAGESAAQIVGIQSPPSPPMAESGNRPPGIPFHLTDSPGKLPNFVRVLEAAKF